MSNLKDRGSGRAGFRSFSMVKPLLVIISVLLVALYYYATALVVAIIPEENKKSLAFSTRAGDTWHISLTHSVERTLWEEFFRIGGVNKMTMTHTTFSSLGWGFPYSAEDGKLTHREDGRYELAMGRPFTEVPLIVSVQAMQHFHHGNVDLDLCALYGQGTRMKIKAMYRYQYWLDTMF